MPICLLRTKGTLPMPPAVCDSPGWLLFFHTKQGCGGNVPARHAIPPPPLSMFFLAQPLVLMREVPDGLLCPCHSVPRTPQPQRGASVLLASMGFLQGSPPSRGSSCHSTFN